MVIGDLDEQLGLIKIAEEYLKDNRHGKNIQHEMERQLRQLVYSRLGEGQWIKEGKYALNWPRLSCRGLRENEVRLKLFIMVYNSGNFFRMLVSPEGIRAWPLRTDQSLAAKECVIFDRIAILSPLWKRGDERYSLKGEGMEK